MAYLTGEFQSFAKNVEEKETKNGKRMVTFNFEIEGMNGEEKVVETIECTLLDEDTVIEEGLVRIKGSLQLNAWEKDGEINKKLKIISSEVLDTEGETVEGSINGAFQGYSNFIEEKETKSGKRMVTFALSLSEKIETNGEVQWANYYTRVNFLDEKEEIEKGLVRVSGTLNLNAWEKEGNLQKSLSIISSKKEEVAVNK